MEGFIHWFFDGFGFELLSILVGIIVGGTAGFHIGRRKTNKFQQSQKAGDSSNQINIGKVEKTVKKGGITEKRTREIVDEKIKDINIDLKVEEI